MKIMICDDNGDMLSILQQMLQKIYGNEVLVESTRFPQDLPEEWQANPYKVADVILMDIEFSYYEKNGIAIAGEIQKKFPGIKIIFITGTIDYAQDIFDAVPSSFLVKPVDAERLKNAIDKVQNQLDLEEPQYVWFQVRGNAVKVPLDSIRYIESSGHQVIIHADGNDMVCRMKLIECVEMLPEKFWRIHQSYIVNAEYIRGMMKDGVELMDRTCLPVARSKYKEVKDKLLDEVEKISN